MTEGRRAFLDGLSQIESGAECDRLAPHLSALADGEATPSDLEALRPHLATCLACRARLRENRAVPARVAALVPLSALDGARSSAHPLRSLFDSIAGAAHDRWTALTAVAQERVVAAGDRLHQATELAAAQKAAVIAASAVALSSGAGFAERPAAHNPAPASAVQRPVSSQPAPMPTLATDAPGVPASDRRDSPAPTSADPTPARVSAEFGPELPPPTPAEAIDEPDPTDATPAAPTPATAATDRPEPGAFER